MPLLYLALGLLALMTLWALYRLKRKRDALRRKEFLLNIAAEVERGERPRSDLERYGIGAGPWVGGDEVKAELIRELGIDEDDPHAPDHVRAHKYCRSNRELIRKSESCGCFHCASIISSRSVSHWREEDETGLCPQCGVDSLLPAGAGFPMTAAFMKKMRRFWFDKPQEPA